MNAPRPWSPGEATKNLREKARGDVDVCWTKHAKEQMAERDLLMGDVLYVLKNGFVYEEGEPATRPALFKYKMECTTPNSGGRNVRVVLIPSSSTRLKIVTVMWVDENRQRN